MRGLSFAGAIWQRQGLSLNAYVGVAYSTAALVLLPIPFIAGLSYTNYSLQTFFWIALLALIPQLIGHTSINNAMRYLNPTLVATAMLLSLLGRVSWLSSYFKKSPLEQLFLAALFSLWGWLSLSTPPVKLQNPSLTIKCKVRQDVQNSTKSARLAYMNVFSNSNYDLFANTSEKPFNNS